MVLDLLIAVALVLANGFFVASEFALARLRPTQVGQFERDRRAGARSVRHAIEHLDAYLATCQLGITIASIGLGVAGEPAFVKLLSPLLGAEAQIGGIALAATLAFALITLLHVIVGELAPKSIAISRTSGTVLRLAPPMRLFYLATKPLVDLLNAMGNALLRPFHIPPARDAGHAPHTESELRELLAQSAEHGMIEDAEQQFAERGFAFGERRVRDVMQPRSQIDFLTINTSVHDAARYAIAVGHTRLPVCEPERGRDAPLGIIHAQDLLAATLQHQDTGLQALLRPLDHVPEATPVSEVLNTMRRDRHHMILVADEHGTTVGLLTLEDLLEELVGEIDDEFDPPSPPEEITHENQRPMLFGSAPLRSGTPGVTPTDAATAAPLPRRCGTLAPPTGRQLHR